MKQIFYNKNVVITGGSSGIGLAMATAFARQGAHLFLIARHPEKLEQAAIRIREHVGEHVRVHLFPADVSDQVSIEKAIAEIGARRGGIHTLVCNAGVPACGYFQDIEPREFEKVLRINYLGALWAAKAAWPYLSANGGEGRLCFVSSVAGYTGLIGYSAYAPTKFAMTGLAECLRMEGKKAGIRVTVVFPPDTDTPLYRYEEEHGVPELKTLSKGAGLLQPETVAEKTMAMMTKGKFEVPLAGGEGALIRFLKGVWPGLYYRILDRIAFSGK